MSPILLTATLLFGSTGAVSQADRKAVLERWPEARHAPSLDDATAAGAADVDGAMIRAGEGAVPVAFLSLTGKNFRESLPDPRSLPPFTDIGMARLGERLNLLLVNRVVDAVIKPAWVEGRFLGDFRLLEGQGGGFIEAAKGEPELRLYSVYRGGRHDQRVLTEPRFRVSRSAGLMALHLLVDGVPAWRWISEEYRREVDGAWAACGEDRDWQRVLGCLRERRGLSSQRASPTLSGVAHQYGRSLSQGWARGSRPSVYLSARSEKPTARPWAQGLNAKRVWESLGTFGPGEDAKSVLRRWLWSPAHTTVLFNEDATHFGGAAIEATEASPGVFVVVMRR